MTCLLKPPLFWAVMLIEIVTHCWRYSRLLAYQLSSLILNPPVSTRVKTSVFCDPHDLRTVKVVKFFAFAASPIDNVEIAMVNHNVPALFNRAIGRNQAALSTQADVVWFADCDYLFGLECLDTLANHAALKRVKQNQCHYPDKVLRNITQAHGDEYARRWAPKTILNVDPAHFAPHRPPRAIGGIQIVSGDAARKLGYAPQHAAKGVTRRDRFDFRSDVAFRKQFAGCQPLSIVNVFRIRQTYHGQVDTAFDSGKEPPA